MQIHFLNSHNVNSNTFNLTDINQNLQLNERQILRKALMQIPSKDLPKVLQKIKQIPVDEYYLKNIINLIEQEKTLHKEGFEIYA
ncbi:hypothetical protein [Nautilia lithotrophica]